MTTARTSQIAFLFRYGPAEHTELFHCMPEIISGLAQTCTVHYYGLTSSKSVPESIKTNAKLHLLPITVKRADNTDKILKTILWLFLLPWIALHCRLKKIDAIYIDETLPLSVPLARIFFRGKIAITVTDFFLNIYGKRQPALQPFVNLINAADLAAWRKLPLIFTRAKATRDYLKGTGVPEESIMPVYDPCDTALYHPMDKPACKQKFGFSENDLVLVHHGILHPNKGNAQIIEELPELLHACPRLRFLLIGDGPEMPFLKRLVREKKLENIVKLTGWLPKPEDVNIALNAGDIGLAMRIGLDTDHFAMTGTLIHNMACALPILAARLRSIEEVIIDGQNGFLFDPENMTEFRTKLLKLSGSHELRRDFGQKALQIARERFAMQQVAAQTIATLKRLVE